MNLAHVKVSIVPKMQNITIRAILPFFPKPRESRSNLGSVGFPDGESFDFEEALPLFDDADDDEGADEGFPFSEDSALNLEKDRE